MTTIQSSLGIKSPFASPATRKGKVSFAALQRRPQQDMFVSLRPETTIIQPQALVRPRFSSFQQDPYGSIPYDFSGGMLYQQYQTNLHLFRSVDAMAPGVIKTSLKQELTRLWEIIRDRARLGNEDSVKLLHAVSLDLMYDELVYPVHDLTRPGYESYYELEKSFQNGAYSAQEFREEVQWRALEGISVYYFNTQPNEHVANAERFVKPVLELLETSKHPRIQQWGTAMLREVLFNQLPYHMQESIIEETGRTLLNSPPGAEKRAAIITLSTLNLKKPNSPAIQDLIKTVDRRLQQYDTSTNPKELAEVKYYLGFMGHLLPRHLNKIVQPWVSPDRPSEIQQMAAWTLGRVHPDDSLGMLREIISNPWYNNFAKEMAVASIGKFSLQGYNDAIRMIEGIADPQSAIAVWDNLPESQPDNVIEAAKTIQDRKADAYLTAPDFYINRYFPDGGPKKQQYLANRNRYVQGLEKLDTARRNMVDRALLPYAHHLRDIVDQGFKHHIVTHSITEVPVFRKSYGMRTMDGRMEDLVPGTSSPEFGAVTRTSYLLPDFTNGFAHEFTHHLHQTVLMKHPHMNEDIRKMFMRATQENRILDDYAAMDYYEYLAQAGEAMDKRFIDHACQMDLMLMGGYYNGETNCRSKLLRLDPDLYDFIATLRREPLSSAGNFSHSKERVAIGGNAPGQELSQATCSRKPLDIRS